LHPATVLKKKITVPFRRDCVHITTIVIADLQQYAVNMIEILYELVG